MGGQLDLVSKYKHPGVKKYKEQLGQLAWDPKKCKEHLGQPIGEPKKYKEHLGQPV